MSAYDKSDRKEIVDSLYTSPENEQYEKLTEVEDHLSYLREEKRQILSSSLLTKKEKTQKVNEINAEKNVYLQNFIEQELPFLSDTDREISELIRR